MVASTSVEFARAQQTRPKRNRHSTGQRVVVVFSPDDVVVGNTVRTASSSRTYALAPPPGFSMEIA
jgi:hypothetical protein